MKFSIEWLREHAMFSCQCEECRRECSYPADMLAVAPNGEPICENCYEDDPSLYMDEALTKLRAEAMARDDISFELPSWTDLPCFEPFAAHEGLLHALIEWASARNVLMLGTGDTDSWGRLANAEAQLVRYAIGEFPVTEQKP